MLPFKPLPENHGDRILELWVVSRDSGKDRVELAEHSDGAIKAYGSKQQAEAARDALGEDWAVETIWLLDKGCDVAPEAYELAKTGMFSEQAIRDIDGLVKDLRARYPRR